MVAANEVAAMTGPGSTSSGKEWELTTEPLRSHHRDHTRVRRFRLVVEEGGDAGTSFVSSGDRAVIGTHESVDLRLADRAVSRFHCEVVVDDRAVTLSDLSSRNGTVVDGVPVLKAPLRHGAWISIGKTRLRFHIEGDHAQIPLIASDRFGLLVGSSPAARAAFAQLARAAATESTVLLDGETGTGKELAAESLHRESRRREAPFLVVDCGALPAELLESELFGHERGSFTGADRLHKGYFERANRGTLFLDEIGEMPMDLQIRLLRVLETSTVSRVGGTETIKVDVRIIAATNQRPEQAVAAGRLRQDLLYRLNVFPITLPPLRERGDDVLLLAEEFLRALNMAEGTAKEFSVECLARLRRHTWPGNVRELRNAVHCAFILAKENCTVDCLPPSPLNSSGGARSFITDQASLVTQMGTSLAEAERRLVLATLDHFGDCKRQAAQTLGISLKTLYNRLREYRAGPADRGAPLSAMPGRP